MSFLTCVLMCTGDTLVRVMRRINVPVSHGSNSCTHARALWNWLHCNLTSASVRKEETESPSNDIRVHSFLYQAFLSPPISWLSHPIKSLYLALCMPPCLEHHFCLPHLSFPLYVTPLSSLPPPLCHSPPFSLSIAHIIPLCLLHASHFTYRISTSFSLLPFFFFYFTHYCRILHRCVPTACFFHFKSFLSYLSLFTRDPSTLTHADSLNALMAQSETPAPVIEGLLRAISIRDSSMPSQSRINYSGDRG